MGSLNNSSLFQNVQNVSTTMTKAPYAIQVVYTYAVIGTGGMVANMFILAVLISNRKLLKQSANIAGIAVTHIFCAVAIGCAGYFRAVYYDYLNSPATTWSCAMKVFPALQPISFQSMGVMLVLVGMERFSLFVFPNWYRASWTNKRNWQIVGLIYGGILISTCVGLYKSWYLPPTTLSCGYMAVLGKDYFLYGMCISALGGSLTICLTVAGLVKGTIHYKKLPAQSGEATRNRRQLKVTHSMLSVAVCDFCLVVMPSFFYILSTINPSLFPDLKFANLSNFTNMTYCANTMTSLISYLIFHRQFRNAACRILSPKKWMRVKPGHGSGMGSRMSHHQSEFRRVRVPGKQPFEYDLRHSGVRL